VVVDAERAYGSEVLACVRWFFVDTGLLYQGDCRWLPAEILVKEGQP
jgi:hypothetical protein